jgi:hypothetical protein
VSLTEANPFDPQIAVTATGRRLGYDLRLEVAGSVASPSVNFSSSPPLDSERVLLLVMAGESPEGEINYSGQQRFVRLGAYLGQSFFSRISADPARAERFALTSGERVSRQGRETYAFSYPLDDRWALVGEYDEFDDYNLGVKWRIFRDPVLDDEPPAGEKTMSRRHRLLIRWMLPLVVVALASTGRPALAAATGTAANSVTSSPGPGECGWPWILGEPGDACDPGTASR